MSDEMGPHSGTGNATVMVNRHRRPIGVAVGSAGTAIALAILVVCAPGASASRGPTHTTFVSPFAGQLDDMGSSAISGCGHASDASPPVFNLTSGVGKGVVTASSANCAPNLNGNSGDASEQFGLASANFTTTTGVHHLTAKWSFHFAFAIKTSTPTGHGSAEAIGTVSVAMLVFDGALDTVVNQTSSFVQHIDLGNTTTTSSGNANRTLSMTASLVAGHVYYIYVYAYIFAYAIVISSPGATATSKVDVGSGTNKATLHDYTFT